jgi:hypothetical protein
VDDSLLRIFTAPLKLSAPTSLMQNANTDATLVCHANKPYDECLWTTPYGVTYRYTFIRPAIPSSSPIPRPTFFQFFFFVSTNLLSKVTGI